MSINIPSPRIVPAVPGSNSRRSLYTENSQQSDIQVLSSANQIMDGMSAHEQKVSDKMSMLPVIVTQEPVQKPGLPLKAREKYDGMPSLPHRPKVNTFHDPTPEPRLGLPLASQFKTIAVMDPQRSRDQYNQTGIGQQPSEDRERMLRSSQGGRWYRSQSLMQDKPMAPLAGIEAMARHYHRHQSKKSEDFDQYLKMYRDLEKQLTDKKDIYYKFKINLTDSVEQVKAKMEAYLETKIELSNLPIDRPDADWGQEHLLSFYTNYQQVLTERIDSQDVDSMEGQKNRVVTILKKYKNCCYYGPIKDGKKHGFGYLHYFSGRFFEGLFENDQKVEGFEMDDSELYLGKYHKNQRHGHGILKTNEYLLAGIFNNGQFKVGSAQYENGETKYQANQFSLNKPSHSLPSKGLKIEYSMITYYPGARHIVEKNSSGDIFIGQVNQESQKQGEGFQVFGNGDVYVGRYEQGAPEGYGEYYWGSGAFYRGQFLTGMRHGKGVWMMLHGDRYEGDYLNDKKSGRGVYTWKTGDYYQGQFQNDYRHGYGEMYWQDGTSFKGNWLNGIEVNKTFKLSNISDIQPRVSVSTVSKVVKNSYKTVQAGTRVLKPQLPQSKGNPKSSLRYSSIQQTLSQPSRASKQSQSKRIHLDKLKSMLNPSNSIN